MAINTQTIRIDLNTGRTIPVAFAHQNDTNRQLTFQLYNNGVAFTPTSTTVKFAYKSPIVNGRYSVITGSQMASGTVSGNTVTVTLPEAYTQVHGVGLLTMILTTSGNTLRPVNIKFVVQSSADGDDVVLGASDWPAGLYEYMDDWLAENEPTEIANLKSDLSNINDVLELPLSEKASFSVQYDAQNYIENLTLKKGVTYTLTGNTESATNNIYVYLKDASGNNLIAFSWNSESEKTGTYTPTETKENCYIRARSSTAAQVGTVVTVELTSNEQNAIDTINSRIDNLPNSEELITEITGYEKPNLISGSFREYTYNGVTYTVNDDGSVHAVGTATNTSYTNASVTLAAGNYLLNGCTGGASQTYHLAIILNGSFLYQYDGKDKPFTLAEETTIPVYCRVISGQTVDVTFYPMIRSATVYNPTYAPYGQYQIYKPIQRLIDYTAFNWSGKKMNVIGDSIVQGSYGNFINVIRDILCLSVARNYGVGGSCLASSSADSQYPPAVLRYENMDTDAQIIIVHAGTNDYSAQIPLGDPASTDITTFNGALNVMMNGLREMYPTALIIFDSILHRFNDGALTIKASEYRQCIEDRCLANHVVFYDAYKYSGFDFVKGYYDHILTSDGLHPNQTGANILGRKLAGFIRWN